MTPREKWQPSQFENSVIRRINHSERIDYFASVLCRGRFAIALGGIPNIIPGLMLPKDILEAAELKKITQKNLLGQLWNYPVRDYTGTVRDIRAQFTDLPPQTTIPNLLKRINSSLTASFQVSGEMVSEEGDKEGDLTRLYWLCATNTRLKPQDMPADLLRQALLFYSEAQLAQTPQVYLMTALADSRSVGRIVNESQNRAYKKGLANQDK